MSSAADHFHAQARQGAVGTLRRCPDFVNFYSALPHFPSASYRLDGGDHLPYYVSREHRPLARDPRDLRARSSTAAVCGPHRWRFSQRPFLKSGAPIVVVHTERVPRVRAAVVEQPERSVGAVERTVGTQSDYRESDAQTDPYSPDAAEALPSAMGARQKMLAVRYHCDDVPEIVHLADMHFSVGQRPGAVEVERIYKLRAKRAFEASLPPLSDLAMLPVRQAMVERWEEQVWHEREAEIAERQGARLARLRDAIEAREAEVEAGHAERVQLAADRALAAKQAAFAKVLQQRIKAIRRFSRNRKCEAAPRPSAARARGFGVARAAMARLRVLWREAPRRCTAAPLLQARGKEPLADGSRRIDRRTIHQPGIRCLCPAAAQWGFSGLQAEGAGDRNGAVRAVQRL